MRDFSWTYFSMTGDVDAYLLYKDIKERDSLKTDSEEEPEPDGQESALY